MSLPRKLLYSLVLLSIISVISVRPAAAVSDLASAGLDIVTEIANSQDAAAGVKNYSKDKFDDWLWQAAGGYENILSGNLGESQLEQIKGKFDTIQTVINGITQFALAVDAGRYDEALYHTIETTVNTVDHPLVSATWAAAKLTYQSHQLVKDTKAETEIARLFHMLHKDRRLFSAAEGEMKQIPENADTVDYFFNKYIVTDPSGRTMVRAYVEQRLGEEWPEESWGSWLKNLRTMGTGLDTGKDAEVEALTGQYKNTARNWIRNLIKDVNLEAQRWYKEKELKKLMAEFEAFRQEFGEFSASIDGLIRGFARMKEIQAREDSYRDFLAESEKSYQSANKRFASLKENKPSGLNGLYSETVKWENELTSRRRDLSWAGMKPLADSYLDAISNWHELRVKIFDNLPPVITDPVEAYQVSSEHKVEEVPKIFTILTSDLLKEPEFIKDKSRVEELKTRYLEKLSDTSSTEHYRGNDWGHKNTLVDLDGLNNIASEWVRYYSECNGELQSISHACERRYQLYKRLVEGEEISEASEEDMMAVSRINQIAEDQVAAIISEYDAKYNPDPGGLFRNDQGERISYPNPDKVIEYKKDVLSRGLLVRARDAVNEAVVSPAALYLGETGCWFSDRQKALGIRMEQRRQQYEQIENALIKMRGILTGPIYHYNEDLRKEEALKGALSFSIKNWLQGDEEHIMETVSFEYGGVSARKVDISAYLEEAAANIENGVISQDYLLERETGLLEVRGQIEAAEKVWDGIVIPDEDEEEEIKELVDKDFSVKKLRELGTEIKRLAGESQEIPAVFDRIMREVEADYDNCLNTAGWLKDTAYRMDLLLEDLKSSGLIKDNFVLNLPEGSAYIGENTRQREKSEFDGMILAAEPYPHLMQSEEINKLQSELNIIKNKFTGYKLYSFYNKYAGNALKTLNEILELKRISDIDYHPPVRGAAEDIIVHPNYLDQGNTVESLAHAGNFAVIRESKLEEAEIILKETAGIAAGEVDENYRLKNEKGFLENIRAISELLPLTAEVRNFPVSEGASTGGRVSKTEAGEKVMPEIKYLIEEENLEQLEGHPLAERYRQFALDLREVFYKYHHRAEEEQRKGAERLALYDELAYRIEGAIDSVNFFINDKDYENALLYEEELEKFKEEHAALGADPGSRVPELLAEMEGLIKEAERLADELKKEMEERQERAAEGLEVIRAFYEEFARRYQSRDEFGVLSLLADEWEAGDGSTLWDLEETLARNFRVFDEISYQISNLRIVENQGDNRYLVYYDLKIVSEIYDRNVRHEENSTVRELVEVNEGGSGRIIETLGGRFWRE